MNQRHLILLAMAVLLGAGAASLAAAESAEPVDEITVKGQTLRGTVVSLGSDTLGFGYVYEDFRDEGTQSNTNSYASGFIGLDASYKWDIGAELRGSIGYWPGLANTRHSWLFRSELTATVPIWDPLAFRATIININDNNPDPNTGNNKFQTIMGVALRF